MPGEDPIRGEVELTEADVVAAYAGYGRATGHIASVWKVVGGALLGTTAVVAIAWPVSPGVWSLQVAFGSVLFWFTWWQWRWMGRRSFAQLPEARRRYVIELRERELFQQGPRALVTHAWSNFDRWYETESAFLLVRGHAFEMFLPKRAFAPQDLHRVRSTLADKVVAVPAATPQTKKKASAGKTLLLWVVLIVLFIALYNFVAGAP